MSKKPKNNASKASKASKAKAKGKTVETIEASETLNSTLAPAAVAPAPPVKPTAAEIKEKMIFFFESISGYLELFHDPDNVAYVTYQYNDIFHTCAVDSKQFRGFLQRRAWDEFQKAVPKTLLSEQIEHYSMRGRFDGPERPVFLRVGEHGADIFIDLHNDAGQAVRITADGWTVVSDPDCKFRRAPGMRPLPTPVSGGSITELDRFLNLSPNDRILFLSFLLAAFRFNKPTPILLITGEHGSGKTTLSKIFRSLVDPSKAPAQTASNDERDLLIACNNSWVVNIDNQSKLSDKMSDNLCRLATGSSLRTRKLHTDAEEQIFSAIRPVLLNSIEELATRSDFLDRSVHLHTQNIGKRMSEQSLETLFQQKAPLIFGALMDAVVCALKLAPTINVDNPPRMADFTKWACAGAPALGFTQEEFLAAYEANRTAGGYIALEASPIYLPLMTQLETSPVVGYKQAVIAKGLFRGTTKELLAVLTTAPAWDRPHDFPKTPKMLAGMLARITPNLRAEGVEVKDLGRDPVRRVKILEITQANASKVSESEPISNREQKRQNFKKLHPELANRSNKEVEQAMKAAGFGQTSSLTQ